MIRVKTKEQIAGIRDAGRIAANCLQYLEEFVVEGITTLELNAMAAEFVKGEGATNAPLGYMGYPMETCISVNECICHGIPNKRQLKNGDILNIDVTAIKNGFYGDTSRMYTVGEISEEAQDLIACAQASLEIGIDQVQPTRYYGDIGYAIAVYAMSRGYSVVHQFCGHGTGIEFHEEPQVPHIAKKGSGPIMLPGHVFTIEPMINCGEPDAIINESDGWTANTADNKLSAQFEHTLVVTEDGCEILTLPA